MIGLAQGVVGVWGTALMAAAKGVAYCRQHGTPPRGFDHMLTDDHVTKATEGLIQAVEEFQSELGAAEVQSLFERGREVVAPVSASAAAMIGAAAKRAAGQLGSTSELPDPLAGSNLDAHLAHLESRVERELGSRKWSQVAFIERGANRNARADRPLPGT